MGGGGYITLVLLSYTLPEVFILTYIEGHFHALLLSVEFWLYCVSFIQDFKVVAIGFPLPCSLCKGLAGHHLPLRQVRKMGRQKCQKLPLRLDSESNRCEGRSRHRVCVIFFLSVIVCWKEQRMRRRASFESWLLGNFSSNWWEGMVYLAWVGDAAKALHHSNKTQKARGTTRKGSSLQGPP